MLRPVGYRENSQGRYAEECDGRSRETREEPPGSGKGRLWGHTMDQSLKTESGGSWQSFWLWEDSHHEDEQTRKMRHPGVVQLIFLKSQDWIYSYYWKLVLVVNTIERLGYKKILSITIYIKINHFMPIFLQIFFFLTDSICNKTGTLPHFLTSRSQVKTYDAF